MHRIRFILIGGFLGAGKTTTIARLARHYIDRGQRVGLVTNDQARDLVDTQTLRAQGFRVGEITGACFCCNFNALVESADTLIREEKPDVIIAEPVGSCADLVATVIEPLRRFHGQKYEVAPFVVLLKPEHGRKILGNDSSVGFSPKAAYIFLKQIEEADVVVINKIDKFEPPQRESLLQLVQARFPDKRVLAMSARHGDGFDRLIEAACVETVDRERAIHVDYDTYAEGDAELGWLNCSAELKSVSGESFSIDDVVIEIVSTIRDSFGQVDAEVVHLKLLAQNDYAIAVANLVASDDEPELSFSSGVEAATARVTINARVATVPDVLQRVVKLALHNVAAAHGISHEIDGMQCFRPGRPVPTHRIDLGSE